MTQAHARTHACASHARCTLSGRRAFAPTKSLLRRRKKARKERKKIEEKVIRALSFVTDDPPPLPSPSGLTELCLTNNSERATSLHQHRDQPIATTLGRSSWWGKFAPRLQHKHVRFVPFVPSNTPVEGHRKPASVCMQPM